ncbi:MAG: hypothetical protein LUI06_06290 [Ruminococcus sp.]|nr:hypothetical protein [Ruminococcus sp.]
MIKTYIYYSLKLMRKNLTLNILSIAQITVAVILLNFSIGAVSGVFSELIFAEGFDDESLYVVQANGQLDEDQYITLDEGESSALFENIIDGYCEEMGIDVEKGTDEYYSIYYTYDCMIRYYNQHKKDLGIEGDLQDLFTEAQKTVNQISPESKMYGTTSIQFIPTEYNGYIANEFEIIDTPLAERLNFNILKGKNLSQTSNNEDTIEAIIYGSENIENDISLGDYFYINIFNFKTNEYEEKKVVVTGILDSPYYLLDSYFSFSEDVDLDTLINRFSLADDDSENGIINLLIKPWDGFDFDSYSTAYNSQYYLELSGDSVDIQELKNKLTSQGYEIASVKSAYDNSKNEIIQTVSSDLIIIVISVFMVAATLFAVAILSIQKNKAFYVILRNNGARLYDNFMIGIINIIMMIFVSDLLAFAYMMVYNYYKHNKYSELFGIVLGKENLYATIVFSLFTILVFIPIIRGLFTKFRREN